MSRKKSAAPEDMEAKKKKFQQVAGNLEVISSEKFLKDNFLPYAWSFTLERALVDVTGLKPVQRRIVYSMFKDGLSPAASRSKVATLGGRVLAYHPHGDTSVVDALKNLARDHIFRVPLIDGKGDFGAPGTPGAAGRYISARLNKAAWLNVEEIAENAVHMAPNYDGSDVEPVQIPVKWPVSVINGGSGIAVGYASNMPSHNPTEIMKACKAILKNPDITHKDIRKIVLGPDFNMGGLITSHDGINEYLETGSGSFKLRGKYNITTGARSKSRIEFYEIPAGTFPEKIIKEIQAKSDVGQFKEVASYKDLSDLKHPIRVIVETKPSVNPQKVIQDLFKFTSLESNFPVNITTIVDNTPQQSSMKDLLLDFIGFRKVCISNKSKFNLGKRVDRLHLMDGLMKVLLDIDKAISIIRGSNTTPEANESLQKHFKIDKLQADYVLSLQLRRLTKMDKAELIDEKKQLDEEIAYLEALINDPEVQKEHLMKEFDATLKVIGDERKTEINGVSADEFLETEKSLVKELKNVEKNLPCFVTRFADGSLLKSSEEFRYMQGQKKYVNTPIIEQIKMRTHDFLVIVDSKGIGHKVPLSYLVDGNVSTAKDAGLTLDKGVTVVGIAKYEPMKSDIGLALGTKSGAVKISKIEFPKSDEFPVITLEDGDEVVDSRWLGRSLTGSNFVFVTKMGNVLVFDPSSVRPAGHKAGGVRGIKLKGENDDAIHFGWVESQDLTDTMLVTYSGKTLKSTLISEIPPKNKGGMGVATQIFKSGETELKRAFVGLNVASCVERSTHNAIAVPPVVKRSTRGSDFNIDVLFGSSEVTVQ